MSLANHLRDDDFEFFGLVAEWRGDKRGGKGKRGGTSTQAQKGDWSREDFLGLSLCAEGLIVTWCQRVIRDLKKPARFRIKITTRHRWVHLKFASVADKRELTLLNRGYRGEGAVVNFHRPFVCASCEELPIQPVPTAPHNLPPEQGRR